jgi:putative DNA methylase
MPGYRKKLIEVALPLKAINEASAREKSIRHGHPSTLHLWWARRPLAACRAVLFASLVDDPDSDPAYQKPDGTVDEERAGIKRAELFNLIEELVRWENSNNPRVINAARAEIARCVVSRKIELRELAKDEIVFGDKKGQKHTKGPVSRDGLTAWELLLMKAQPEVVNAFLAEHAPPVLDPFCGGGSIPLEAQRLGLRAYASDLNPVAVLITKALIEIPPRFSGMPPVNPGWSNQPSGRKKTAVWLGVQGLAEDVRYYGRWMRDEAAKRIGHLYPKISVTKELAQGREDLKDYIGQDLTIIAWLWARTVESPNPAFRGVHVPLMSTFWLSKKSTKSVWLEPIVDRAHQSYRLVIRTGTPTTAQKKSIDSGTKAGRGVFRCIFSGDPIPGDFIDSKANHVGLGRKLVALVAEGRGNRVYIRSTDQHYDITNDATGLLDKSKIPNEPARGTFAGNAQGRVYGFKTFADYFTERQLVALTTFSDLVRELPDRLLEDFAHRSTTSGQSLPSEDRAAYSNAVATYLAFAVDKCATRNCTQTTWYTARDSTMAGFSRQGIAMTWDFAEVNPLLESTGSIAATAAWVAECIENAVPTSACAGTVTQLDAASAALCPAATVSTDPPYYDNIGYADLADFFYVWLRRSLSRVYPSLFATVLTPKVQELIASPYRHSGDKQQAKRFFEQGLGEALRKMLSVQSPEIPLTIFYAFRQSETEETDDDIAGSKSTVTASTGWETMLEGVIHAGFAIDGTWPMRTEQPHGLRVIESNSLASSIVLVCRARSASASLATRKEFINALRQELPEALKNLQRGNIAPVDLAQATIGPGMAVFTRYSKVMESDGSPMTVRTALGIINQVLDEVLAEQEGDFDPDTRWALAWFEQFGTGEGSFGEAETLSKAKNTAINGLVAASVVKARAGKVQLVGRDELNGTWNPATDKRLSVWETTQHLIRTLEIKGESEAAALINKLGGLAETARELAYRLYSLCERKKWAEEALAYNGLVIAWPELTKLAAAERHRGPAAEQREMF